MELWTRIIYFHNKVDTRLTIIKRCSIKLEDYFCLHTIKTQAVKKLKDADKVCNKSEKESDKIRIKFVNKTKKKKAKDYQVSVETLEKQLSREKKVREVD